MQFIENSKRLLPVILFSFAYLIPATLFVVATHNWEFLFYIGVVLGLGLLVLIVNMYIGLSPGLVWFLSLWGLLHMLGGIVPVPDGWPTSGTKQVLYSLWLIPGYLKYDQLIHAYGFGMSTWVCWQAVRPLLKEPEPHFGVISLCALGGMGLGALNEIVEFLATLFIPNTNVGGYENTAWDLVANTTGAVIAALVIWRFRLKGKPVVARR